MLSSLPHNFTKNPGWIRLLVLNIKSSVNIKLGEVRCGGSENVMTEFDTLWQTLAREREKEREMSLVTQTQISCNPRCQASSCRGIAVKSLISSPPFNFYLRASWQIKSKELKWSPEWSCDCQTLTISFSFIFSFYLQVACHLFQAGCNMVKLGIMKTENIAGDIGSLGIFWNFSRSLFVFICSINWSFFTQRNKKRF